MPLPIIERAAARALAVLEDGRSVVHAITAMREDATVRNIDCIAALREIAPIGLPLAMEMVDDPSRYERIGLRELRHLAKVMGSPIASWLREAILAERPWRLILANGENAVIHYRSEIPDDAGSIVNGTGVSVARERESVQRMLEHPLWADEVRVMRDEPDALLLYFPFVAR